MNIRICERPTATEALQVAEVYKRCYSGDASATQQYPFPQFLDPAWIRQENQHDLVRLVAESAGTIVGTVAGRRNIGGAGGGVAEVYGLAVNPDVRGRGIGTALFAEITAQLSKNDHALILAETRAIAGGGGGIVRRHGYVPLGITPLAHFMPAGFESMIMFGKVRAPRSHRDRKATVVSERVRRLADQVLPRLNVTAAVTSSTAPSRAPSALTCVRDSGAVAKDGWIEADVIRLSRLSGRLNGRYSSRELALSNGDAMTARARIRFDRCDQRAVVVDFAAKNEDIVPAALQSIVKDAPGLVSHDLAVCSVELRLGDLANQTAFESAGFVPTVYYPGMLSCNGHQYDCVRYEYIWKSTLVPTSVDHLRTQECDELVSVLLTAIRDRA